MFVKDMSCISPQRTIDKDFFEKEVISYTGNKYLSIEPEYTDLIPFGLLRRMGRAIRIGIGAGMPLLKKNPEVDGIIIGTADAGLEDSIKFLNQILKYDEGNLTPTNFIQSTPNSIAGNLAIMSQNNKYNITHVHKGQAFENSLLDAMLLLEEGDVGSVLVGNIEGISDYNYNIDNLAGLYKKEELSSETLLHSNTKGTVCGEGSAMFIVGSEPGSSKVRINDIDQISYPSQSDVVEKIKYFLNRNNLSLSDIDALVLGLNGDSETDGFYHHVIKELFPKTGIFSFKNIVGEYPTSSAFATWLSAQILNKNKAPKATIYKSTKAEINNILIYNHYQGIQHGLILMSK
ncbi:MAG: beta-ketoacyl synthase chain length factor [Bacteroidota bacterium]